MFKKLTVLFLSLCIAAAMILGASSQLVHNEQENVTLCIMDFEVVSC